MATTNSIINLDGLSKPATTLIEKISDATGGLFKPYQIKRVAKAEAEADKIKAISKIEITQLQERAVHRFFNEEAKKQENIESITRLSLPLLSNDSKPQNVEDDWITNFFDKARLISDRDMQNLWSKILAGEANNPGNYSKRTVNMMASMDKGDALLFNKLCNFNWVLLNGISPIILDLTAKIYTDNDINFGVLKHLDSIGLISFEDIAGYINLGFPKKIMAVYQNTPYFLEFEKESENSIEVGKVLLTVVGTQLANIMLTERIKDFDEYVIKYWVERQVRISSPYNEHVVKVES